MPKVTDAENVPLRPEPTEASSAGSTTPDELARALSERAAWGPDVRSVEWIQTHISHVFLVDDRVFKLRKAVSLPFLDFGSRSDRNADCLNELVLNRRLAPDVYLGIAPILVDGGSARVGPVADDLSDPQREHVVVMRRLPAGRDALSLILNGSFRADQLTSVSELLSSFHATHTLGKPAPWSAEAWLARIAEPVLECLPLIEKSERITPSRIEGLTSQLRTRLEALEPVFEARRLAGCAVDAHGDLHLDHLWYEKDGDPPLLIDCIEFNEDLRHIDRASEVAFLAMDLRYRDRRDLAEWLLASYAMLTDDYSLFSVVDFYAAYRALVRAKVAALAASQPSIAKAQRTKAEASVEKHWTLAEELLEARTPGELVLLCGTVGSGKSTVARSLAESGGGIPISSDRVRKRLAGIAATTHSSAGPDEGIYDAENTQRVYRALLERAEAIVESGRTALLDASYTRRSERDRVRRWAEDRGLAVRLIEVRCTTETALDRLTKRAESGNDPSDAGPDFLALSVERFEPPDEWPAASHEVVWSG